MARRRVRRRGGLLKRKEFELLNWNDRHRLLWKLRNLGMDRFGDEEEI